MKQPTPHPGTRRRTMVRRRYARLPDHHTRDRHTVRALLRTLTRDSLTLPTDDAHGDSDTANP